MELYHVLTLVAPLGPGAGAWQALSVEEMGKTIAGFITTTMFLYSGDTGYSIEMGGDVKKANMKLDWEEEDWLPGGNIPR